MSNGSMQKQQSPSGAFMLVSNSFAACQTTNCQSTEKIKEEANKSVKPHDTDTISHEERSPSIDTKS
jgi:hypothetical protein